MFVYLFSKPGKRLRCDFFDIEAAALPRHSVQSGLTSLPAARNSFGNKRCGAFRCGPRTYVRLRLRNPKNAKSTSECRQRMLALYFFGGRTLYTAVVLFPG
jgi:hypothetical protein